MINLMNPAQFDFTKNPLLVYWETTRACALACRHCRASAMPSAHPLELNTEDGKRLLDEIAAFGAPLPHLVMTGGDPLQRTDLGELITYARSLGIRVSVTPAATPALTRHSLERLKELGVDSIALSLDGSCAPNHDAIRQVPGCFERTIQAAKWAGEMGLPLQINTLVSKETVDDLPRVYEALKGFPLMRWSLFFLIAVGRGTELNELDPEEAESFMGWVYDLAKQSPFEIKTTEAPSYRRVAKNRMEEEGMSPEQFRKSSVHRGFGIRDGNGIMFVSNLGQVFPAGFLPIRAGNVRAESLRRIYRENDLFRRLRDTSTFEGKCGECEYRKLCGGSRARAYAHTGSATGSDPICRYQPG